MAQIVEIISNAWNDLKLVFSSKPVKCSTQTCPFISEQEKIIPRVNSVFPGQQNYGNCGIQSMKQLIELITCKKIDEVTLLKDTLKDNKAGIVLKGQNPNDHRTNEKYNSQHPNEVNDAIDSIGNADEIEYRKKMDKVLEIKKSINELNNTFSGKNFLSDEDKEKYANKVSEYNKSVEEYKMQKDKLKFSPSDTGGTTSIDRNNILEKKYGVEMEADFLGNPPMYDRNTLSDALKENKATIMRVDAYKLPGWTAPKNGQPGPHAIVIAAGKYDENGNLQQVLINDTGIGKQTWVNIDQLEKAAYPDSTLNITKKPINQNCKS